MILDEEESETSRTLSTLCTTEALTKIWMAVKKLDLDGRVFTFVMWHVDDGSNFETSGAVLALSSDNHYFKTACLQSRSSLTGYIWGSALALFKDSFIDAYFDEGSIILDTQENIEPAGIVNEEVSELEVAILRVDALVQSHFREKISNFYALYEIPADIPVQLNC
ncbi:hypothetical protein QAD02_020062 [Eretmocerus hayati]|uniref:Uncharacterized protein n=1 Tax=Eretmocerus hayati TaxID=131215 RepID=A0ACC2PR62_9HYME|nr:hypothetical protein QAD02_020062 [Eretmocerus hayati]